MNADGGIVELINMRSTNMAIATSCLAIVNLSVVCGNVFVLYILISQKSLHTSTNFIVLSLTLSDFLLGVLILPFSILQEYSLTWMFSDSLCKLWLALDVLLSTASIYNLLAISFDRYMAVRQPIKYRFISSNRMTKITIATVWFISSALSLPPLIFDHFGIVSLNKNYSFMSLVSTTSTSPVNGQCTPVTSSDWYILFSAFVSFILPIFLMVGLNFSIFYTVSDSTKLKKIQKSSLLNNRNKHFTTAVVSVSCDEANSLLRIHRGKPQLNSLSKKVSINLSQRSLNILKKNSFSDFNSNINEQSLNSRKETSENEVLSNFANSLQDCGASIDSTTTAAINGNFERHDTFSIGSTTMTSIGESRYNDNHSILSYTKLSWLNRIKAINQERQQKIIEIEGNSCNSVVSANYHFTLPSGTMTSNANEYTTTPNLHIKMEQTSISSTISDTYNNNRPQILTKMEKSAINQSVWHSAIVTTLIASKNGITNGISRKKQNNNLFFYFFFQHHQQLTSSSMLRTDLRVARTISVVVGCFIVCWLPFTIIYVLQAFQTCPVGICIPKWFFTLAFWFGYANSALNPLLFAAFSRDFRSAFRKVLIYRALNFRNG